MVIVTAILGLKKCFFFFFTNNFNIILTVVSPMTNDTEQILY